MKKILAVITALAFVAIVFAPAMGFTISSGARTNYSINSERVNYTIGSGTPAQETVYSEEMAEHYATYSISSKAVPYSIKLGAIGKYSTKAGTNAKQIEVLGGQKPSVLGTPETMGKGLVVSTENVTENASEQAAGHVAQAAKPAATNAINLIKVAGNLTNETTSTNVTAPAKPASSDEIKPANVTGITNVTALVAPAIVTTPANASSTAPATMEQKFKIEGFIYDDQNDNGIRDKNESGLFEWTVNLEQPSGKVIRTDTTNKVGNYRFPNLIPGEYVVSEVLRNGWSLTSPANGKYAANLTENITGLNFGNSMMPNLQQNVSSPANVNVIMPVKATT